MRLTELDPTFIQIVDDRTYRVGAAMSEADGVQFLCPVCFLKNGGPIGTHIMICWAPHVPVERKPAPGRWPMMGTGFADLTLTPSIAITGGCNAHFFITNGEVILT